MRVIVIIFSLLKFFIYSGFVNAGEREGGRGKKNKKRKKTDTARDVTEDNPLTPFNKGDLENALDFYCR